MSRKALIFYVFIGLFNSACVTRTINNAGEVIDKVYNQEKLSEVYTSLSSEYLNNGALNLALDRVNLAITTNKYNYRAYMIRGIIYQSLNKLNAADDDFKTSLKLNNNYPDTYVNYGSFLCSVHKYNEALENFSKAIENPLYLSPEIAYYNRGKCYFQKNDLELANQDLLQSINYKHIPQYSYVLLSELNYKQGNYIAAKFYIEQFSGIQSAESLWVHIQILHALMSEGINHYESKQYASYEKLLAKMLLNSFQNSSEARQYITLYGEI